MGFWRPPPGIGAPRRGAMLPCKVCGAEFRAKEKGQQCCSRPCQVKSSQQNGWGKWSSR